MSLVFFLVLVTTSGLAGYAVLAWIGLRDREAWAIARAIGPILVIWPAWWVGSLGLSIWPWVGGATLVVGAAAGGWVLARRRPWKDLLAVEIVYWFAVMTVVALRWDRPNVTQTEKFMDFGIFATLLRCESFPPPDMWLAGETLPYYYWGSLPWAFLLRLSGLSLDQGYNLVVALVAATTVVGLWCLGARLAGSWAAGWMAAFFGLLAGTPDGLRQFLAGFSLTDLDLWASSRQVPDTITEFPLFSFWLGDLHPHVLSLPIAIAAIAVGAASDGARHRWRSVGLSALLFGVTWAANPWAMPPTLLAVALTQLIGDGRWHWPDRNGWRRWAAAVAVAAGGWLLLLPFHLDFHPPSRSVKTVFAWTAPGDLLLYGGALLIPAFLCAVVMARAWVTGSDHRKTALVVGAVGLMLLAAVASGRPTTVFLSVAVAVMVAMALEPERDERRLAWALGALALFLFLVPELVYLEDGYGDQLHRMNTVFKAYFQGWMLLSVCAAAFVRRVFSDDRYRTLLAAFMVLVSIPHLMTALLGSGTTQERGLDGLAWMPSGDRSLVVELRSMPPGTTMVEAVGDAYSEYGRLSAASGVPTVIGWENHEMVWRGTGILEEARRRRDLVNGIYTVADPGEVRRAVEELGAHVVAIGNLERQDYSEDALTAVSEAGEETICGDDGALLVVFRGTEP